MKHQATWGLTDKWYPVVLDTEDGGYFTTITYDFKVGDNQDKMIVTQSRHLWVTSQAAMHYNESRFLNYAEHGFDFLKTKMWDANHGGFYDLVDEKGVPIETEKPKKTAYGNAFAIYGLAAYYKASGNKQALELAKKPSIGWKSTVTINCIKVIINLLDYMVHLLKGMKPSHLPLR